MVSPIYFFTRSGCTWCKKMQPVIEDINKTLTDEQKIEIHNIDVERSRVIYDSVVRQLQIKSVTPLLYNSNIGTHLLGYRDKKNIVQFLRAENITQKKPLSPMPKFDINESTKKDFANWKKSVILWYEKNKNDLPTNVISQERMINMVYTQFMAYRTKPKTVEERLTTLEEKVEQLLKK